MFTELSLDEIAKLEDLNWSEINEAKIVLANEATAMLHGRECLAQIQETIENMFKGAGVSTDVLPCIIVLATNLEGEGKCFTDLFLELKLASSKQDVQRLIAGGGAKLGDDKIESETDALILTNFEDGITEIVLPAGKKRSGVVEFSKMK